MPTNKKLSHASPHVSVIIASYNGREWLGKNINALRRQKPVPEIILVDNGSTDGTVNYTKKYFPFVKIVALQRNFGFAFAINKGTEIATGDYFFIENADMRISKNYFSLLTRYLKYHPEIAAAQGLIYHYFDNKKIQSAGHLINSLGLTMKNVHYFKSQNTLPIYILSGDALLVRKKVFEALGGFDPLFRLYFEDYDFSWRLWLKGYKIRLVPSSKIYHYAGGSTKKMNAPLVYQHTIVNSWIVILCNLEIQNLIPAVLVKILIGMHSLVNFILKRQYYYAIAHVRAWLSIMRLSKTLYIRRNNIQRKRKISDTQLFSDVGAPLSWEYVRNAARNAL